MQIPLKTLSPKALWKVTSSPDRTIRKILVSPQNPGEKLHYGAAPYCLLPPSKQFETFKDQPLRKCLKTQTFDN